METEKIVNSLNDSNNYSAKFEIKKIVCNRQWIKR